MGQSDTELSQTTDADASTSVPAPRQGAGRRILVIEDEPSITEAIRFILQRDEWAVSIIDRGDVAVATITGQKPDLVILDVMLPGLSGLEVLRILRGTAGFEALPVIMLTARGQSASRTLAIEYGATEFIAKPFANADLVDAVRRLAAS